MIRLPASLVEDLSPSSFSDTLFLALVICWIYHEKVRLMITLKMHENLKQGLITNAEYHWDYD